MHPLPSAVLLPCGSNDLLHTLFHVEHSVHVAFSAFLRFASQKNTLRRPVSRGARGGAREEAVRPKTGHSDGGTLVHKEGVPAEGAKCIASKRSAHQPLWFQGGLAMRCGSVSRGTTQINPGELKMRVWAPQRGMSSSKKGDTPRNYKERGRPGEGTADARGSGRGACGPKNRPEGNLRDRSTFAAMNLAKKSVPREASGSRGPLAEGETCRAGPGGAEEVFHVKQVGAEGALAEGEAYRAGPGGIEEVFHVKQTRDSPLAIYCGRVFFLRIGQRRRCFT